MNEIRDIVRLRQIRQVEDVEEVEEYEEMDDLQLVRQPVVYDRRADHKVVLNLAKFQRIFRFNQPAVYTLVTMLNDQLYFPTNCGQPLSVLQQFLVALNHYAGGHFHLMSGLCGGVSQSTVFHVVQRVS